MSPEVAPVSLTYATLFGEQSATVEAVQPTGRAAATIRCSCGRQLADVRVDGAEEVVVTRPVRLTRQHAASELIDLLLRDFEHLYARRHDTLTGAEIALWQAISPLISLTDETRLETFARAISSFSLPEAVYAATGLGEINNPRMLTACRGCRRTWNVAPAVVAWQMSHRQSTKIIVNDNSSGAGRSSTAVNFEELLTEAGMLRRVGVYRRLIDALQS